MSTKRLAESVQGLNSSLALVADDLWPKKGRPIAAGKGLITTVESNWEYHKGKTLCRMDWRFTKPSTV